MNVTSLLKFCSEISVSLIKICLW